MKPGLRNGLVLAAALLVAGLPVRAHTPTPEEAEAIAMAALCLRLLADDRHPDG